MTEQKNQLESLFAACWKEEALKARIMSEPKAALAERGFDIPDGLNAKSGTATTMTEHTSLGQSSLICSS